MTRFKRELLSRGICYEADEIDILMKGAEYDCCEKLVSFTSEVVITVFYSAVLDPILHIYDARTLTEIGEQNLYPERSFSGCSTWDSHAYT